MAQPSRQKQNANNAQRPVNNIQNTPNKPSPQKRAGSNGKPQMQRTKIQNRPVNRKQVDAQAIRQKQTQRKKINYDDDFEYEYYPYDE